MTKASSGDVSRFRVPDLGIGVGYRVPHYRRVVDERPEMDWFEVLSENFMVDGGSPRYFLERLLDAYPVVNHGVSASLGSVGDPEHLRRLRALSRRIRPPWVSDHLCWVGDAHHRSHDLLPVPYTKAMRDRMVDRIRELQDALGVPFAVENVSSYLTYRDSVVPEWEFLAEVVDAADCAILLDVNNIFVSSVNHGFDPYAYLAAIPLDRVVQIHLAGHSVYKGYRLDTHDAPVCDEVWALYGAAIRRLGPVSTLIEWDGDVPTFERLQEEAALARRWRDAALADRARDVEVGEPVGVPDAAGRMPPDWQTRMLAAIRGAEDPDPSWFAGGAVLTPREQIGVYQNQYRLRIYDALVEDVPGLAALLADDAEEVLWAYLRDCPPRSWTLNRVADRLPCWLAERGAPSLHVDMARLDDAVMAGFEALDEVPLDVAEIPTVAALELAPHVRLLRLRHNVHAWRSAALSEEPPPELVDGEHHVVVFRVDRKMRHLEVDEGALHILELIRDGFGVGDALERLVDEGMDVAELSASVGAWFELFGECGLLQRMGAAAQRADEIRGVV